MRLVLMSGSPPKWGEPGNEASLDVRFPSYVSSPPKWGEPGNEASLDVRFPS